VTSKSGKTAVRVDAPVDDDLHLRAVLEAQPVTLVRLGRDGTVLAVNEAGLAVIGAERLEQILETSFLELLQQDDRSGFLAFIERVAKGHRGSLEVGLTALTGTDHAVQIHAAPHPGAPDGIDSVLIALRDVTESRRLEQSLVEAMARQAEQEAAHEAARDHLAEELRLALQNQGDSDVRLAEITELKNRLLAAESDHASAIGVLVSELEKSRIDLDAARAGIEKLSGELEGSRIDLDAAHADIGKLSGELEGSRIDLDAARADIGKLSGELEKSRIEVDESRASIGMLNAELEKSRADIDATRASMRELDQTRRHAESALASLTEEAAQSRSDAEAIRAALEQEVAKDRVLLETAEADATRQLADIAALRDALNASMNEQAEAAARSRLEADSYAARLALLETALAAAERAKQAAIARLREVTQGTEQLVRRFIDQAAAADDVASGTPAGELGARLEAAITAAVDARLPVTVMVAEPDVQIDAAPEIVEQALVALATNRALVVTGGQVAIELAAVDVDEGAARSRGGMARGAYVLVAMHVLAANAHAGLAPELFECPDGTVWESAGPTLFVAFESMRLARGWIWLAREGASGVVFELYLPRAAYRLKGEQG
jgi:PAS domain S-box-containing protein